ncbi:MAG: prepilin-type N-terminal cleavage/methylation domain-containing protein [Candidatus Omnitrophica bacterium]|jgi:prepilin-type N-terminal cleavage/methylation domain-containing protein|nr:prepilin-type N-terminal cleavage/methylation domain-containing protein [Candidatus Omnitrophota bacterium]
MLKKGFALIEILIVTVIVLFLYFQLMNKYFKKGSVITDTQTQKALNEQGISTTSYKSIVNDTKSKIEGIQAQRAKELEEIKE